MEMILEGGEGGELDVGGGGSVRQTIQGRIGSVRLVFTSWLIRPFDT